MDEGTKSFCFTLKELRDLFADAGGRSNEYSLTPDKGEYYRSIEIVVFRGSECGQDQIRFRLFNDGRSLQKECTFNVYQLFRLMEYVFMFFDKEKLK